MEKNYEIDVSELEKVNGGRSTFDTEDFQVAYFGRRSEYLYKNGRLYEPYTMDYMNSLIEDYYEFIETLPGAYPTDENRYLIQDYLKDRGETEVLKLIYGSSK